MPLLPQLQRLGLADQDGLAIVRLLAAHMAACAERMVVVVHDAHRLRVDNGDVLDGVERHRLQLSDLG
ncbi:hypothetical protein FNU76_19800 [Chitinimonas arctica]|uniref:Uncharacterized protein n=1 Tax=Chitinimonas arctica TaxID=2594795 RepID=A0A516SJT4_9NEIS|nr:hypothetical protein [Chitinimonas arctica]QDQ28419.1 hypothetical protein FNU76_19800 [Chitinimonas arctica]